jgi:hypothetical protein
MYRVNWSLPFRSTLLALLVLWQAGSVAKADTITGIFSDPVLYGYILNETGIGSLTYADDTGTAVIGTATPASPACAGSNMLCWGTGPDLDIPASEQYSELTFTGSTSFNSSSSASQQVGTISYLNGTSDDGTTIFGATLSFYDNSVFVGSDNVIISTTENQYSGTGLTQAQLQTDADYINICGNDSNICASSIEAYEDSEGGTGVLVDLSGTLIGDPMLVLNGVNIDPSQGSCTTCGTVGNEPALGEVPEPSALALMSTGLILCIALARRKMSRL